MSNSKTALCIIAVAAAAVIYAVAASPKIRKEDRKKIAGPSGAWKEHTMDSFTGWLERLKQDIGNELNQV